MPDLTKKQRKLLRIQRLLELFCNKSLYQGNVEVIDSERGSRTTELSYVEYRGKMIFTCSTFFRGRPSFTADDIESIKVQIDDLNTIAIIHLKYIEDEK